MKRLLTAADPAAAARIAAAGPLRRECEAAFAELEHDARDQAGEGGVRSVIGRRFALYPQPDRTEGEWAEWWASYVDTLSDVPYAALESGMLAWVADKASEFLPKPGVLRDLTLRSEYPAGRVYARAKAAMALPSGPPETPPPPPADKAAVAAMMEEFRASSAKVRAAQAAKLSPTLPPVHAKVGQDGISEELLDALARQR